MSMMKKTMRVLAIAIAWGVGWGFAALLVAFEEAIRSGGDAGHLGVGFSIMIIVIPSAALGFVAGYLFGATRNLLRSRRSRTLLGTAIGSEVCLLALLYLGVRLGVRIWTLQGLILVIVAGVLGAIMSFFLAGSESHAT
jgi:hypothetical protein